MKTGKRYLQVLREGPLKRGFYNKIGKTRGKTRGFFAIRTFIGSVFARCASAVKKNLRQGVGRKLKSLGRHILVEFHGCNKEKINELKFVESAMIGAAEYAKATVIDGVFHKFNPHGVSGVVVIAESHLAIHTWPEYGYAAVDLFTCGDEVDPWDAFFYLNKKFEAESNTTMELKRGLLDVPNLKNKVDYKEKAFTA